MADNINELKSYFTALTTKGKREFIKNLEAKIGGIKNSKYAPLLKDCIKTYNAEVAEAKKAQNAAKTDLSNELFAKAIASMLQGREKSNTPKIVGRWEREGKKYYIHCDKDGSFETNDFTADHKILEGQTLRGFYRNGP